MAKQKRRAVTAEDVKRVLAQTEARPSAKVVKKQWDERFKTFGADVKARNEALGISKTASGKTKRKPVVPVGGKNVTEAGGKYLGEANRANDEAQALSGKKPPERDKSIFEKGLDVLLRGQYAGAEAFKRGFNPNDDKAYDVGGAFEGFASGITGKSKTSYSDILKEYGNYNNKAQKALGFGLDVFGDPTTYLGVGLLGKAAKATSYAADGTKQGVKKLSQKEIREGLEESADIARKGSATPFNLPNGQAVGRKDIVEALGVERAAVSQLGKRQRNKLSTEARELYELAKSVQKQQGKKTLRRGASESDHLGKKTSSGIVIKDILEEMSNYSVKATRERFEKEAAEEVFKKTGRRLGDGAVAAKATPIAVKAATDFGPRGTTTVTRVAPVKNPRIVQLEKEIAEGEEALRTGINNIASKTNPKISVRDEIISALRKKDKELSALKATTPAPAQAAPVVKKTVPKLETVAVKGKSSNDQAALIKEIAAIRDAKMAKVGLVGVGAKPAERVLHENVVAAMNRNLSTTISNQLSVRVGTAKLGVPGVAALGRKSAEIVGKPAFVQKSVKMFEDGFRANAHISPSLRSIRRVANSTGATLLRAYGRQTQSVFDVIPAAERQRVARLYGNGQLQAAAIAGGKTLDGQPVDNIFQYLDDEIASLDATIRSQGILADELGRQLPDSFKLQQGKSKTDIITQAPNGKPALRVKGEFELDTDYFTNGVKELMKAGKIKDPAKALYVYNAAVNKVIANKKLWETVAQTHGAVYEKGLVRGVQESADSVTGRHTVTSKLGGELVTKYGWRTPEYKGKPIQGLENYVFEPEIATALERMGEMYSSAKSTGDILKNYDRSLVAVKSILTKYNPSFHPRTFMGEYILGFLGGMRPFTQVDSYKKSVAVWRGHSAEFMGKGRVSAPVRGVNQADIEAQNVLDNVPNMQYEKTGRSPVVMKFQGQPINADTLRDYYMKSGLKSGYASTDTGRGIDATITGGVLRGISDATQTMTESIEDIGRMAHFIDVIRHSKSKTIEDAVEEAAQVVAKTHLDYTEITKFERDGMSRVIPFYKWLRLSTPLMAETLLTQPGKALVIPKALDAASRAAGYDPNNLSSLPGGPDAAVPEYLLANGGRPVGSINGNTQWFNPVSLFPLAGSAELLQAGSENPASALVNTINPLVGLPFELGLDAQNKGSTPSDDYGKFAASQTPQTNFGRKLLSSEDPTVSNSEKILKFLGNPGLISNTPRTIEGAAYQEKMRAELNRRETKRKLGILEPKK